VSPDHHMGEQNTTQQGERDGRASVADKDRRNQREGKLKRGEHAGMEKMKRTDVSWKE